MNVSNLQLSETAWTYGRFRFGQRTAIETISLIHKKKKLLNIPDFFFLLNTWPLCDRFFAIYLYLQSDAAIEEADGVSL